MKDTINEKIKEFSEPGWFIGDINGTIASHIERERMVEKLKYLQDILYFFRHPKYNSTKAIIEDAWKNYQESIEKLHIEMEAYLQVIDEKFQKENLLDDGKNNLEEIVKKGCKEGNKNNKEGAWKVKMVQRNFQEDYPDWFRKEVIRKDQLDLEYRGGMRWTFKGEVISDGDLFVKVGDEIKLLKQDKNISDSWIL